MEKTQLRADTVTDKSYHTSLLWKVITTFASGIFLTFLILFIFTNKHTGDSYADSFYIISKVREEIIHKSITIYALTIFFVLMFVGVITLLYSHKVAGPLFRLTNTMRQIANGDLRNNVYFRKNDAIHMVANETNNLISFYSNLVSSIESELTTIKQNNINELEKSVERLNKIISKIET